MLCCQYPEKTFKDIQPSRRTHEQPSPQARRLARWNQEPQTARPGWAPPQLLITSSPASDSTTEEFICSATESIFEKPWGLTTGMASSLSSLERDLLDHYFSHTAHAVAFDMDDLYALQVGIPSLAKKSKPLVSSIIALAAVCKCNDIVRGSGIERRDNNLLYELLALADWHHKASLRQTQDEIACADHYDSVLANAPLMVLYASANHSVRIQLGKEALKADSLHVDFAPAQSQWIPLIRAAHLAYTGLLSAPRPRIDRLSRSIDTSLAVYPPISSWRHYLRGNTIISAEDGPTRQARDFLLPMIASTSSLALKKLRELLLTIQSPNLPEELAMGNSGNMDKRGANSSSPDFQACSDALDTLDRVMDDVFNENASSIPPPGRQTESDFEVCPQSLLSEVSPWLCTYLASVTSHKQLNKPLRRTIMFFLNRVPTKYLDLVQTTLGEISEQDTGGLEINLGFNSPSHSIAHRLAMAIFAHWLVLVMLLDGVWWIGDIGAWELERIVLFMHRLPRSCSVFTDENWWPELMLNFVREIKTQVR